MKETTDYLENIVDLLHIVRKKDSKIGARLKHYYIPGEKIWVKLTGNGSVIIDAALAVNGVQEVHEQDIQRILNSFQKQQAVQKSSMVELNIGAGITEKVRKVLHAFVSYRFSRIR